MRVELRNVTVAWLEKPVVKGVNLAIEPGEMVVVLGRSGSGVSLLLKTAAGLMEPALGSVRHEGVDLQDLGGTEGRRRQTQTGFMFQDAALWANTNLEGNLMLPLQAKFPTRSGDELREMMRAGLAEAGFRQDLSQRPAQLSVGRQRFVSFLRATLPDPSILFLDEPILGLDPVWMAALWRRVGTLLAGGTTVLAGSHRFDSWCEKADRVVLLDGGCVVREGTPREIKEAVPEVMS